MTEKDKTMINIKLATMDEFASKREQWNDLVQKMKRPSVFCTWEWINTWFECFGHLYQPFILFLYSNEKLIGILPMAKRFIRIEDCAFPVRVISFCGSRELHSDHIDLLCSEEDSEQCINELRNYFSKIYKEWDVIELSHLPEDSRLKLMHNSVKIGHKVEICKVSSSPYIPLQGNFEQYCMKLSSGLRRETRRIMRVLYGKENVTYSNYDPSGPYGIKDLFDLHRLRQDRKGTKSTFQGDDLLNFHNKVIKEFHRKGWLRLAFLCHSDKPIAAIYGYDYGGRHFGYQMGIDPAWERRSLGNVLIYELIEKSYEMKLAEFDFLRGGEQYKGKWTEESRDLYDLHIYNQNFLGISARYYLDSRTAIKKMVKDRLDIDAARRNSFA